MPPEVFVHFHPESHDQVDDDRRTQREEGGINEVQPDATGRDVHFLSQPGTDTKGLALHEVPDFIHTTNEFMVKNTLSFLMEQPLLGNVTTI